MNYQTISIMFFELLKHPCGHEALKKSILGVVKLVSPVSVL